MIRKIGLLIIVCVVAQSTHLSAAHETELTGRTDLTRAIKKHDGTVWEKCSLCLRGGGAGLITVFCTLGALGSLGAAVLIVSKPRPLREKLVGAAATLGMSAAFLYLAHDAFDYSRKRLKSLMHEGG